MILKRKFLQTYDSPEQQLLPDKWKNLVLLATSPISVQSFFIFNQATAMRNEKRYIKANNVQC